MNRQDENEYPTNRLISQEEPTPSPLKQVFFALAFSGFIIGLPAIIDWLGKGAKGYKKYYY